jgi:hypothetical protein
MLKLFILFAHLLSTCLALGTILITDIRLLRELAGNRVSIAPPDPFIMRLMSISLVLLYITGGGLLTVGALDNPAYLSNPKLQGKLLLVVALTLNAGILHYITFPRLAKYEWVANWRFKEFMIVAIPVALSNSLWLFCAFLGIARQWNNTVSIDFVLSTAFWLFLTAFSVVGATLSFAAIERRTNKRGMLRTVKRTLGACASALKI